MRMQFLLRAPCGILHCVAQQPLSVESDWCFCGEALTTIVTNHCEDGCGCCGNVACHGVRQVSVAHTAAVATVPKDREKEKEKERERAAAAAAKAQLAAHGQIR